ncbi:MAG: hypothetical protein CMH49_05205 [Myxococcales bacterium]|nr:hypothetical protein [Myxococcales bacterium]
MNASLNKGTKPTQPRATIAQLHEAIEEVYLWQNECKANFASLDLNPVKTELEIFNQLLQEKQQIYQKKQEELSKLVCDLLQKYDPLQIFSLLSGHNLSLEHAKRLDKAQNLMQGQCLDEHQTEAQIAKLPDKNLTSRLQSKNHENEDVIDQYLPSSNQDQTDKTTDLIVQVPLDFSIGQAVWKMSHSQLQQLHNPQRPKQRPLNLQASSMQNNVFKNSEVALNHLTNLLNQDYSIDEFTQELKKVLKKSPLDKRDPRLCELLVGIDLPSGKIFKALRKAVRNYQAQLETEERQELTSPAEQTWPFAKYFTGKHIELVGGNPRTETVSRLEKVLPGAYIHWTRAEGKVGDKQLSSLKRQAQSGSIDVVLLITAFMGHGTSRHFMPLNRLKLDENGRRLNVRLVRGGYGLSKLKHELRNCLRLV